MTKRRQSQMSTKPGSKVSRSLTLLNADAAGIDVGASEHYVAVPPERDPQAVRRFGAFTEDLHKLAQWLRQCGVRTVAMESTGVYWRYSLPSRARFIYLSQKPEFENSNIDTKALESWAR